MQDLTCDDCSLMNNENPVNVKTIDPCAVSLAAATNNSISPRSRATNEPFNKYTASLLRGIKLEDAQCDLLTTTTSKPQSSDAVKSEAPPSTWSRAHSMFGRVEGTGTNQQHQQQYQHQDFQNHTRSHKHLHNQHNHQNHHHHHQLLLQGSDDPLISHGADSVINDDDHSVELKHLLTAVTNGQKQQQQSDQQHYQQQQQKQKQQQQNLKQQLSMQSRLLTNSSAVQKRPQIGCSPLTKQQLKVKAGLMSAAQQQQQQKQQQQQLKQAQYNGPAANSRTNPTIKTQPKPKKKTLNAASAATGGGAVKLRFHHQALPPEYLSHYEATQRQQRQNVSAAASALPTLPNAPKETKDVASIAVKGALTAKLPPPKSSHENVRSWLQKIAEIQRAAQRQQQQQQQQTAKQPNANELGMERSAPTPQHDANNNHQTCRMSETHSPLLPVVLPAKMLPATVTAKTRVVNYADLPYMGEITLNNSKPRRGRKPKKADICHLIYKNYGTIFTDASKQPLTKQQMELLRTQQQQPTTSASTVAADHEEPLNLCLRDYQSLELYSVSSGEGEAEGEGDCEEADYNDDVSQSGDNNSNCTTPGDALTDAMLATNMKTAMPSLEVDERKPLKLELAGIDAQNLNARSTAEPANSNLLLQPVRAYYQKLLESGMLVQQNDSSTSSAFAGFAGLPIETIEKDNQIALKIPIPSGFFVTSKLEAKAPTPMPAISSTQSLEYPEPLSTPSSIKSEQSFTTTTTGSNCNGVTPLAQHQTNVTPQKRKRSAIFIPPMPAENAMNPANEVSICKFKFTGGVKPTLLEKKMLSVDSDGNYRYYSGTGDKSMRGYEFFPRESLQQSGFLPGGVGGAGAFLNATGEKISIDIPPPSAELSNELLQIPDSPTGALLLPTPTTATAEAATTTRCASSNASNQSAPSSLASGNELTASLRHKRSQDQHFAAYEHNPLQLQPNGNDVGLDVGVGSSSSVQRKKKCQSSRRISQREKLERTFKEKGFLIQTQQLESAEGATYCKFRQLKKFTRYLFRNWKDYLPDGQVLQSAAGVADAAGQQAAIESLLSAHDFNAHAQQTGINHSQV